MLDTSDKVKIKRTITYALSGGTEITQTAGTCAVIPGCGVWTYADDLARFANDLLLVAKMWEPGPDVLRFDGTGTVDNPGFDPED